MKGLRARLAGAGLLLFVPAAVAVLVLPGATAIISRTFAGTPLPDREIQSRLQAQGYSNIQNLQHEGNRVVVTATKEGLTGQFAVDPTTGKVMHGFGGQDNDDDSDDD